ncbi:MAG: ATP-binding protein, partial [Oligoflexia bacterium]|nr:ATP-binding protein [Oligoflexia bacterium]
NPLKYPMKRTYLIILIMITLVIIIVAIWVGLYMARELTVPVERLVHGAKAVGAGNLDIAIAASGQDEITVLVQSFNKMTRDLRENRERLVQAGTDLERRRLQLEAVLGNIGTGVVAVDSKGQISTLNQAAARLLQLPPEDAISRDYHEVFAGEAAPLAESIRRVFVHLKAPVAVPEATQWNFRSGESVKVLSVLATPLRESETEWGVVAVIDDLTQLIKGQREMAWREVARRIAHEIKNPLTPIKLSAQRLQRRLGGFRGRDGELLEECTGTIIKHTDELKEMVNEFSNFARFPEISPAPNRLNEALAEVVTLYRQAHGDVEFMSEFEADVPVFDFDRDQMKRVLINLLDNAVAALKSGPPDNRVRSIKVATRYDEQLRLAVIEVEDNGPGMADDVRDRVFEPYFSTKKEGTGLGLAIAKRIVNDHDGFIRVHSAPGEGTRFLIELPVIARHQKGI